jgi:6-phosphogluconolactonase/glucosamine-6-phosphate isomerase/deaminase
MVADRIRAQEATSPIVIGIAADSALYGVYEELIRLHKDKKLSFKNVSIINSHFFLIFFIGCCVFAW